MKTGAYIGRFQPFHRGHLHVIETAFKEHDIDKLIIYIGSPNRGFSLKNPMSANERVTYIKKVLEMNDFDKLYEKISFKFLDDSYSECEWSHKLGVDLKYDGVDLLFGHKKGDGSSDWVGDLTIEYVNIEPLDDISSTQIRENNLDLLKDPFYNWTDYIKYKEFIEAYNSKFVNPYSSISTHLTTDALIVDCINDKLLLIQRNDKLFNKKEFAMVGGFVEPHENAYDAMKRELKEETNIDYDMLGQPFKVTYFVDSPTRSDRGRIVSQVHFINIEFDNQLDYLNEMIGKFVPNDEVLQLKWVSFEDFEEIYKYNMFEDHALIIEECVL